MFFRDGLANMISAIRVGYLARHSTVQVPVTRHLADILSCLQDAGAIESYVILSGESCKRSARISLAYVLGAPAVSGIALVSRQSNRCYIKSRQLRRFLMSRRGSAVLSTSSGVLLGGKACMNNAGGELLIWISY